SEDRTGGFVRSRLRVEGPRAAADGSRRAAATTRSQSPRAPRATRASATAAAGTPRRGPLPGTRCLERSVRGARAPSAGVYASSCPRLLQQRDVLPSRRASAASFAAAVHIFTNCELPRSLCQADVPSG